PFNPETTISFSISRKDAENAKIEIYNIKGQKVKQFSDIRNKTSVIWDGLDDNGKSVSSGQYVVKLQQNGKETATKIMLLK
ncbi:MAG: T9SS type A sorting domain-containing protein, partial [Armatimonadetes bacterium]|nr:T9SS type A sorting domain-containing protein [Armatimonadota bacterium]